jgi:NADPH:quinone reductase-like Zn-dependent oxidoreductase
MTSIPDTMHGVQLAGHGGPEKLVWNDAIPLPKPRPGQVLVQVLAAGVNNTDINTRVGWYSSDVTSATEDTEGDDIEAGGWGGGLQFPRIQGGDLCGRVVAHGSGVSAPEIGARVTCETNQPIPTKSAPTRFHAMGSEFDGAFAQYCVVDADQLFDVSASPLSDIEIGAMPCAWGTAWNLIQRSGLKAGEHVYVTGASGGVGLAAVALGCHLGATVTAQTAAAKASTVRDAGAHTTIGRDETPPPGTFDVWIDVVGGDQWPAGLLALKSGGRLATSGAIAGPIVDTDLRQIYLRDITIFGCTFQSREIFSGLVDLINAGDIRPIVSKTYPLHEIGKAQQDFASKEYAGKLVLIP